jgi:hypothetical protein
MPFLAVLAALLLGALGLTVLVPLSLLLRYRAGTARRQARTWVAAVNAGAIALSAALFLAVALVTSFWVPNALRYSLLGLAGGVALGLLGLAGSRWETTPRALHYTPNRLLVFLLLLAVAARMVFGLWRAWHAWRTTPGDASWLAASGAAGSLGVGAMVLGYYFAYWIGVWRRVKRHQRSWSVGDFRRSR